MTLRAPYCIVVELQTKKQNQEPNKGGYKGFWCDMEVSHCWFCS